MTVTVGVKLAEPAFWSSEWASLSLTLKFYSLLLSGVRTYATLRRREKETNGSAIGLIDEDGLGVTDSDTACPPRAS